MRSTILSSINKLDACKKAIESASVIGIMVLSLNLRKINCISIIVRLKYTASINDISLAHIDDSRYSLIANIISVMRHYYSCLFTSKATHRLISCECALQVAFWFYANIFVWAAHPLHRIKKKFSAFSRIFRSEMVLLFLDTCVSLSVK